MKKKLVLNSTVQRLDATRGHFAFPSSSGYSASDSVSFSDAWRHFFHLCYVRMLNFLIHRLECKVVCMCLKDGFPRYIFCRFPPCRTLTHFRWFLAHFPISFLSFRLNVWISERLKGKDLSTEESDGRWLCDRRGLATTLSICLLIPTWSVYYLEL